MQVARTLHAELAQLPRAVRMALIMTKMDLVDPEVMQSTKAMRCSSRVQRLQHLVASAVGVPRNTVSH